MTPRTRILSFSLLAWVMSGCVASWPLPEICPEAGCSTGEPVSSSTTGSPDTGEPTGGGFQTVTGAPTSTQADEPMDPPMPPPPETTGTTSLPEENAPPTVKLSVEPDFLDEAGETALLSLAVSDDVVTVRLSMDGGEALELTPADFPYVYEPLSAKDNGMPHVFTVEVADEEGLTATDEAELTVLLPASGAEKCFFQDQAVNGGTISAVAYTETAIVAVGSRDTGSGLKAAIWKLDPDHCEVVLPGWPKTIVNWTGDANLAGPLSILSAVAVDEHGHIAVGGNLFVGGKPQRYTALLTESGGRLWERTGLPGEAVSSVVIAPNDLVISGGWYYTSENPPRTDGRFWRHMPDQTVWKEELKAPFTEGEQPDPNNWLSEKIWAMLIEPEFGFLVVVGEREFMASDNNIFTRAFVAHYAPLGPRIGSPSTSPGDANGHDAVRSIAVCGDELIAGGWTRADDDPNAAPQPLFRWVSGGIWSKKKLLEPMTASELRGVACDREGKVIGAGIRSLGGFDAKVFAFTDPLGARIWYEKGVAGNDEATSVACDARGFCAWGGYRTINGKPVAVVRVHHP